MCATVSCTQLTLLHLNELFGLLTTHHKTSHNHSHIAHFNGHFSTDPSQRAVMFPKKSVNCSSSFYMTLDQQRQSKRPLMKDFKNKYRLENTNVSGGELVDETLLADELAFDDDVLPAPHLLSVTTFLDFAEAAPTVLWFAAEFSSAVLPVPLPPGNAAWSVLWIACNTLCTLQNKM